jgi:hypothetical protein
MVLEGKLPQGEEEQFALPGVLAGGGLEDGHKSADVLDTDGLRVEYDEDRGFMEKQRVVGGVRSGL